MPPQDNAPKPRCIQASARAFYSNSSKTFNIFRLFEHTVHNSRLFRFCPGRWTNVHRPYGACLIGAVTPQVCCCPFDARSPLFLHGSNTPRRDLDQTGRTSQGKLPDPSRGGSGHRTIQHRSPPTVETLRRLAAHGTGPGRRPRTVLQSLENLARSRRVEPSSRPVPKAWFNC